MFVSQLCSCCLSTHLHNLRTQPGSHFSFFSFYLSSLSKAVTKSSAQNVNHENPVLLNYLINTLEFPKSIALTVSNRFHWIRSVEKPELVVHYLKSIGFTDAQIHSAVRVVPQLLIADVEKTLKPKIQLLHELGITGPDLGKLISTKAIILTRSVEKTMKPSIEVLSEVLINSTGNGD